MSLDNIPDLIALGLTEREAKLYLAMMGKPEWLASELQRITGIQKTRVYQTLETMVSRQYCTKRSEGRYNFYRATPPKKLHEALKYNWEEELKNRNDRADHLFSNLSEVYEEATKDDRSLDFIEIVQTHHRIYKRFMELMMGVQEEVLSLNRSPYSFNTDKNQDKGLDKQIDLNYVLAERGAVLKSITMHEEESWQLLKTTNEGTTGSGIVEARMIDYLPIKMVVFDRKTALMTVVGMSSAELQRGLVEIIVHDASYSEACCELFDSYWNKATPFDQWLKDHP